MTGLTDVCHTQIAASKGNGRTLTLCNLGQEAHSHFEITSVVLCRGLCDNLHRTGREQMDLGAVYTYADIVKCEYFVSVCVNTTWIKMKTPL